MDSKQSLEFIRTLIARSENEPEIKEMLKKATLMNKVAQVFSAFDDGHLENLYEMNVNRAGAKMFLQSLKGQGKAPKQVVIQSHPNHVQDFKKFFPATVPFAATSVSVVTTQWDESTESKSKNNAMGFYNDYNTLVSFLKDVGFQAPFKISVTGKSELTLTYTEEPAKSKLLFDNLMASANALKESMSVEKDLFEKEKALRVEVSNLEGDWKAIKDTEETLENNHSVLRAKSTRLERELSEITLSDPSYEDKKKETEKALKDADKAWQEYQKEQTKRKKAYNKYYEKKEELSALQTKDLSQRVRAWESLDWEGGLPTEEQLGRLISILGGEYGKLRGNLPYKKVITVKLSCAIKSSSGGYEQGNFKNLKDFIKLSIF